MVFLLILVAIWRVRRKARARKIHEAERISASMTPGKDAPVYELSPSTEPAAQPPAITEKDKRQLALTEWISRKKSNAEVGRMYERYLGYKYEQDGWTVAYNGATAGLHDMGRDLICTKDTVVKVVQAKYWSRQSTIHEKHIFQLYGTTQHLSASPEYEGKTVIPVFTTTAKVSAAAKEAALKLGVVIEHIKMDHRYPTIKCVVHNSERYYILPFDAGYDTTHGVVSTGGCYVSTVNEAERLGYHDIRGTPSTA